MAASATAAASRRALQPWLQQAPRRAAGATRTAGRRRPLSTTTANPSGATGAGSTPPPPTAGPGAPATEGAGAAAAEEGSWSRKFKIAAYVLGPLSLPVGFVAAIVYDPEFRDDVDRRFPEIVDAVRQRVGFEEDLRRRRADLEKAFISSQPVGVTVQLQSGARYAERVSPLKTLGELYDSVVGGQPVAAAGPIVAMDFEDISGDAVAAGAEEPAMAPDERMEAPHPNDQLAVVPKPLRGMVGSSLWDLLGAQAGGAGGAAGDAISMTQQQGQRSERQVQVDTLEASLRDIDEEVTILREALRTGSSLRAIDDIENDIAYLNMRRREVKRELRGLGKWWRW